MSICQALLRQVRDVMQAHPSAAVGEVSVRIGALSGVEPALLEAAFAAARDVSGLPQARLVIERVAVRLQCTRCGAQADAEPGHLRCPHCGAPDTRLLGGDECLLVGIELLCAPVDAPPLNEPGRA